jgi:integrase/recombinase XerD
MDSFDLIDFDAPLASVTHVEPRTSRGQPLVDAHTDAQLARAYLVHGAIASATAKALKTDLTRFLLWCSDKSLALSDLRVEHLAAYRDFLLNPQPREKWVSASAYSPDDPRYDPDCGTRWPRSDPRWRPFSGPLSPQSARQSFRAARALLAFAKQAGYLDVEPSALVKNIKAPTSAKIERFLGPAALRYVEQSLDSLAVESAVDIKVAARMKFLYVAFVTTGARLSELSGAKMGAITRDQRGRHWLTVLGKGQKVRKLPVCDELLGSFRRYRQAFGLTPSTYLSDPLPMVLSVRRIRHTGISPEATADVMSKLFQSAASLADKDGNVDPAVTLREASTHWLRHENLTAIVNGTGGNLKLAQLHAGHNDIATTGGYLHLEDDKRHDEVTAILNDRYLRGSQ